MTETEQDEFFGRTPEWTQLKPSEVGKKVAPGVIKDVKESLESNEDYTQAEQYFKTHSSFGEVHFPLSNPQFKVKETNGVEVVGIKVEAFPNPAAGHDKTEIFSAHYFKDSQTGETVRGHISHVQYGGSKPNVDSTNRMETARDIRNFAKGRLASKKLPQT